MRRAGGGRIPMEKTPDLAEEVLRALLEHDTARRPGDGPTLVTPHHHDHLGGTGGSGISVSLNAVARLLHQVGLLPTCQSQAGFHQHQPERNLQFKHLANLRPFPPSIRPSASTARNANWSASSEIQAAVGARGASMITTSAATLTASPFLTTYTMPTKIGGAPVVGVSHDTPFFAAHAIAPNPSRAFALAITIAH